jgi:flagellar assembly protein FliH
MATVIRSAQISDEAVTLAVHESSAISADRHEPVRVQQSLEQLPPIQHIVAERVPGQSDRSEETHQSLMNALRVREEQLRERERLIEESLEEERRQAREEGYLQGYKQGEAEALKLYRERLDALHTLIESSGEAFSREISGLEDVVVGIVFEAVCKIVGTAMVDRDGVPAVVRQVTGRVKDQEKLVLRVSPQDYNVLYQNRDDLFGGGQGIKHELVADDRVMLGGCLIETSGGTIDGRLEIQLQQLRDTLLSARKMLPE